MTFFFTFFFYGWASLQALLEADGVYLAVCAPEARAQELWRKLLRPVVSQTVTIS